MQKANCKTKCIPNDNDDDIGDRIRYDLFRCFPSAKIKTKTNMFPPSMTILSSWCHFRVFFLCCWCLMLTTKGFTEERLPNRAIEPNGIDCFLKRRQPASDWPCDSANMLRRCRQRVIKISKMLYLTTFFDSNSTGI